MQYLTGHFELYSIAPDGGAQHRVTHNEGLDTFPSFSRDGTYLLWISSFRGGSGEQSNIFKAVWRGD